MLIIYIIKMICSLLDYRNAIYYGQLDHKNRRHGIGLLITDDSEILLCQWDGNTINGQYFYTDYDVYAYGTKKDNKFDGENVFIDKEFTVFCKCYNNLFDGNVVIKCKDNYEAYEFKQGQKIKQLELNTNINPFTQYFPNLKQSINAFLSNLIAKSNVFDKLELERFTYYGCTTNQHGEGIGFVMMGERLFSSGMYHKTDLHGVGRLYLTNEIYDGMFKHGFLNGIGAKWNSKRNSYTFGIFSDKHTQMLSQGNYFPIDHIRTMRNQFHLRSTSFVNDWILTNKLMVVDLRSVLRSPHSLLVNKSNQMLSKMLKQHFPLYEVDEIRRERSNKKVNHKQKSAVKPDFNMRIEGIEENRYVGYEYLPVHETSKFADDNLVTAIKEYEVIRQLTQKSASRHRFFQ